MAFKAQQAMGSITKIDCWNNFTGVWEGAAPTVPLNTPIGVRACFKNTGTLQQSMVLKNTFKKPDGNSLTPVEYSISLAPSQEVLATFQATGDMVGAWSALLELYGEELKAILSFGQARTWCRYCHSTDYRFDEVMAGVIVRNTGNMPGVATVELQGYSPYYGIWGLLGSVRDYSFSVGNTDLVFGPYGGGWEGYPFRFVSSWGEVKQGTFCGHCQRTPIYY